MAYRLGDLNELPGAADLDELPGAADLTAPFAHLCPRPYALLDEARSDVPGGARLALLDEARGLREMVVEPYQTLERELSISCCPVEKAALVLQRDFTSADPAIGQGGACDGSSRRHSCGVADKRSKPTPQADPARAVARRPARASAPERR